MVCGHPSTENLVFPQISPAEVTGVNWRILFHINRWFGMVEQSDQSDVLPSRSPPDRTREGKEGSPANNCKC